MSMQVNGTSTPPSGQPTHPPAVPPWIMAATALATVLLTVWGCYRTIKAKAVDIRKEIVKIVGRWSDVNVRLEQANRCACL